MSPTEIAAWVGAVAGPLSLLLHVVRYVEGDSAVREESRRAQDAEIELNKLILGNARSAQKLAEYQKDTLDKVERLAQLLAELARLGGRKAS